MNESQTHKPTRPGENPEAERVNGYRRLRDDELAMVNRIKEAERGLLQLLDQVKGFMESPDGPNGELGPDTDQRRWLAIARTDIERGFMAAVRAVARPVPFKPAQDPQA